MKIFFLNTNIGYGGASKMIVWVANQCVKQGHEVTFLTYRDSDIRQPVDSKVKVIHKQLEGVNGKGNALNTVNWIHRFIRDNRFDIGIAFLSPSILRLAFAAKGTGMKLLFSHRADPYHVSEINSIKSNVVSWLNNWAFRQADGYVFQTQMAQAYFDDSIQKRSVVIPNPIRPMRRTMERKGNISKTFVAVGRLDLKQKRQDLLIEAFNIISSKYPEYRLEIYGDGEDEERIKELASINPNIFLMGKTSDVVLAVQNALASVLSSDFEGIPNALLESMSLGVPSISTDCSPGGAAMLIRNSVNGLLTPRGDVKALADAMEYIILHPNEAEAMGKAGMEVNQLYAEDVISMKWQSFINTLKR